MRASFLYAKAGKYVKVNEAKAKSTFTFTGKGFTLRGLKDKKQGIAKVTVDGKKSYEVNLYSASTVYKKDLLKVTGLSSGKHVVTIEWTGKAAKGASKNATEINLDSIVIH